MLNLKKRDKIKDDIIKFKFHNINITEESKKKRRKIAVDRPNQ